MSRTIKDIPYGVLARQAIDHGFIDRNRYSHGYCRLFDHRSYVIRFDIAVDAHDDMLLHYWKRWAEDVREEYPLDYTVEYGVNNVRRQLVDRDDGIDYVDVPVYEKTCITRAHTTGESVLDRLWNDYNPEKYALNINASLRNAPKINVIHASITLQNDVSDRDRMRRIYWLADVPAYMESLGDRHYKYGMSRRWYNDHEDIYPERSTVKSQLRKAANMYNSGCLDDDYDDDIVYRSKPEVLWDL